jgi:hypothetical protein
MPNEFHTCYDFIESSAALSLLRDNLRQKSDSPKTIVFSVKEIIELDVVRIRIGLFLGEYENGCLRVYSMEEANRYFAWFNNLKKFTVN